MITKIADTLDELEQIHRLNHRTFAGEIPQHQAREDGRLVDRFHEENTYLVVKDGRTVAGMMALRGVRPFSLDQKIENLDEYIQDLGRVVEVRLLAVRPEYRHGRIFSRLAKKAAEVSVKKGYDAAVISATTRQLKLYHHLGFTAFGPRVGSEDAAFQPMALRFGDFRKKVAWIAEPALRAGDAEGRRTFYPGPARVPDAVLKRLAEAPRNHRDPGFVDDLQRLRRRLSGMTRACSVEILSGGGTTANDVVAAHLAGLPGRGLILVNGEFGERLVDHALRAGLSFEIEEKPWGEAFELDSLRRRLGGEERPAWIWLVHGETSSGMLNPMAELSREARWRGIPVCVDIVSTLGVADIDLASVWLASGSSGKGLASVAGLAMVFRGGAPARVSARVPRSMDLNKFERHGGVPYTIPDGLVRALELALQMGEAAAWREHNARRGLALRDRWIRQGMQPVVDLMDVCPVVQTFKPPAGVPALALGEAMERRGVCLSFRSDHLLKHGWLQVCFLGEHDDGDVHLLDAVLKDALDQLRHGGLEKAA